MDAEKVEEVWLIYFHERYLMAAAAKCREGSIAPNRNDGIRGHLTTNEIQRTGLRLAFTPDRSDQPFRKAILPRCSHRFVPGAHGTNAALSDVAINAIIIADEVIRSAIPGKRFSELTCVSLPPECQSITAATQAFCSRSKCSQYGVQPR
jgi:hypothetical protein